MRKRNVAALALLVLCLTACRGTSPGPGTGGAADPPAAAPAESARNGIELYQVVPVQDGEDLYQVVSSRGTEGPFALTPVRLDPLEGGGPVREAAVLYRAVPALDGGGACRLVPALDGGTLYQVTAVGEERYYRLKTGSLFEETVFYEAEPAPPEEDPAEEDPAEEEPVWVSALTQEDMDQALAAAAEKYSVTSIAAAAIENGQVTGSGAWGWAVKKEREMTPETKVRVASLTKVVLGMCAMAMEEDGILDLDAPLSEYWGGRAVNPYSKADPTVRTLLSHSSSLKALDIQGGLANLRSLLYSGSSWRSVEPGNGGYWHYNNFGYCVLGTTLELARGGPLEDYLQARLLQPMGIRASIYAGNLEAEEIACLYNSWGGVEETPEFQAGQRVPAEIGQGASYFAGGFTASAVDMAKLVSVLAGDGLYEGTRLLAPETVAEMETAQFTVDQGGNWPFQQCLTLRRQEDLLGQSALCYHTGSAYGVFNLLSYNPDTGNGVVVLTVGTPRLTDERGLYALCAELSADLYARMEGKA